MQNIFGIHKKKFFEEIISLLEKKNGRPFVEITTKHCKKCGAEISLQELKQMRSGLMCRPCYNKYTRDYAKDRDLAREKVYKKRKNYNDMHACVTGEKRVGKVDYEVSKS